MSAQPPGSPSKASGVTPNDAMAPPNAMPASATSTTRFVGAWPATGMAVIAGVSCTASSTTWLTRLVCSSSSNSAATSG